GALLFWSLSMPSRTAEAAVYWAGASPDVPLSDGVHGRDITFCFAASAVTMRPDRVAEIIDAIGDFEDAANIRFYAPSGERVAQAVTNNIQGLACPAPIPVLGLDFFPGDIRVVIPNSGLPFTTGPVPGAGCPMQTQPASSWGNEPWLLEENHSCQYNVKLGDDADAAGVPWRNHTLHEIGHALGLAHEHQRNDVNAGCTESDYGGGITGGLLTPYDRYSVMHYKFDSCGINGNYDHTGLSAWDKLALHIMYPEDNRVAEFVGTTVIQGGEMLTLQSAWLARGANLNFAASNFLWKIDGQQYTGPTLNINLGIGEYTLEFSYVDMLGRDYYYSGPVRVLDVDEFYAEVVAPTAANLPLLYPNAYYDITAALTLIADDNATFYFPAGLFAHNVVIDYANQPPMQVGLQTAGLFYDIEATELATGEPA
ncbi:MAG: hypothetical protein KDE51_27640, partial [Anaerolineales bacterium]|nr:hypothetical protein [Anaerolineales bacterium]